jgi:hypothetical protein
MIKIEMIGNYRKMILLSSIEQEYLRRIKLYHNPYAEIQAALAAGTLPVGPGGAALTVDQRTFLLHIVNNYDNIIIGNPRDLQDHVTALDNTLIGADMNTSFGVKFQLSPFGKSLHELFAYKDKFRSTATKGLWLSKQLNIKCCPYCNGQYTLTITKDTKEIKAKFQFDHFFSQKRYPYLSISLYNLIPACAPCNLSKGDKKTFLATHYHPFYSNIAALSLFKLRYKPDLRSLSIGKVKKLDLTVSYQARFPSVYDFVKTHNNLYDIEPSYNRHHDIVEDLLHKAIVNNSAFKTDVMKIKGLFDGDNALYKRYLLGNYAYEGEILQRPLSKFTQDIARQLNLI